jgi:hypothetical protein
MRTPRTPLLASRILIIALTTWSVVMTAPDLARVFTPLASAGFAADNDGRVYDVRGTFDGERDSPAWEAGLRVGDRLDLNAMRCAPHGPMCTSLISVVGGMGGTQLVRTGRVLTLAVRPADGGPDRMVTIVARRAPVSWISRFVLLLIEITGLAFVLAAAWLAWTRPGLMTMGFWLYALWFNPAQNFVAYLVLQERPLLALAQEVLSALVHGAACAGFLLFALRVPDDASEPQWRPAMYALPVVGIAVAAMQLASYGTIVGFATEGISRATFVADYVVDALTVAILFRRRHGHLPQDYQRMRWVIWGCAIGLPAYILSGVLQSTSLWQAVSGTASVPSDVIGILLLAYGILGWFVFEAVRRPRVVNVSIPLRRITVFSLILSVPILFAHQETEHLRELLHLPEWAWIAFAAVVLFLLGRVHEISAELADHVFNRTFRRRAAELETAAHEILQASTPDAIDRLLTEAPRDQLHLASATVFRREGDVFRRHLEGFGWTAETANTLTPDDVALAGLSRVTPFSIDSTDAGRLAFPTGLAAPTIAVPVRDKIECRAVAFYGPHVSGADLAADEHTMLMTLAGDAALAYARVETLLLRTRVTILEHEVTELRQSAASTASPKDATTATPH